MRSPGMGWGGWLARGDVEIRDVEIRDVKLRDVKLRDAPPKAGAASARGEFLLLGIPKRAELIQGKALGAESGMQIHRFSLQQAPQ